MWAICAALSLFAVVMFYWNAVLRVYSAQSAAWFRTIYDDAKDDPTWIYEADEIIDTSIPVAENVEWRTDARFLSYGLVMSIAILNFAVYWMGVNVPILIYAVILGIPYLIVSGIQSHRNYVELTSEVRAVELLLQSKIYYDKLHALEIQEILDQDE